MEGYRKGEGGMEDEEKGIGGPPLFVGRIEAK
jgi:hypothetical protein